MSAYRKQFEPGSDDSSSFHHLFVQNQRRVFGYILTLLPQMVDAEEVFQQTCVVILGKADQFEPGTDFARWACQIAQYEVYNYRRRQQGQGQRLCFNEGLLDKIAIQRLENGDLLEFELDALRRCVETLPPVDQHLIRERYARKITSRALAVELGRPENTVYKAIQRIRRALRECVERAVARQTQSGTMPRSGKNPPDGTMLPSREDRP